MSVIRSILILMLSLISFAAYGQSWLYFDLRNNSNQFVLTKNPNISAWMDVAREAHFCKQNDKFLCFNADGFKFAIPNKIKVKDHAWTYDDVSYSITSRASLVLLGKKHDVAYIEALSDELAIRFIFSQQSGLIGIIGLPPNENLLLILQQKCGFAAPKNCYKNLNQYEKSEYR